MLTFCIKLTRAVLSIVSEASRRNTSLTRDVINLPSSDLLLGSKAGLEHRDFPALLLSYGRAKGEGAAGGEECFDHKNDMRCTRKLHAGKINNLDDTLHGREKAQIRARTDRPTL